MTRADQLEALLTATAEMRSAQRRFFRTRATDDLTPAKQAEKRVDEMILRLSEVTEQVPLPGFDR